MGRVRSRNKTRWSPDERRIAMEQRLRAQTIPSKRNEGPSIDEWDDDDLKYDHD